MYWDARPAKLQKMYSQVQINHENFEKDPEKWLEYPLHSR